MEPGPRHRPFDLVCFSHLRWGWVYQRPQHLLSRFAGNHRVLYVEEPIASAEPTSLRVARMAPGVWAAVPLIAEGTPEHEWPAIQAALLDDLLGATRVRDHVLWYYTPMAVKFTRHLTPAAVVYDCMDELSAFAGAPKELLDREGELLDSADVVLTGGRSLYEAKRKRHRSVHLFPSSVDKEHFGKARMPGRDPEDQRQIPGPRIGYFGVIDERIDLELLGAVVSSRPKWQFVMVGPVTKIDPQALPRAANIHYLGTKSYADLPAYIRGWDAAIIPFARNEATRFVSPTKTPEYLAAGRPVVSTSIRDIVEPYGTHGLARIADDPDAFAAAIEEALTAPTDHLTRADAFLDSMSWDRTYEEIHTLVEGAVDRRERAERGLRAKDASSQLADLVELSEDPRAADPAAPPVARWSLLVRERPARYDYLIAGAGFAGATLAERLARDAGKLVMVVERRSHIGGNAYDRYDDAGLLMHQYGPHIFHTNSRPVFDYLGQFTEWRPYEHRVLASVDGRLVPMPINLDTINALYGVALSGSELEQWFAQRAQPVEHPRTSEDVVVGQVGRELYEKFFRGYTRKQWGLDPSELDASVTSRVPIRTSRDDRYFTDTYQAMPLHGYTRMFQRMVDHPNITVVLNADYRDLAGVVPYDELVYTGAIDEFFDYRFGKLPYRSLEFDYRVFDTETFQPAPVVNYPNEHPYTRSTEFKYLTGQRHRKTGVMYEYPTSEGDPYYPVPRPENAALYRRYRELAERSEGVHFVGRLATYKYYNMDQVVAQALAVYRRLVNPAARARDEGGDVLGATIGARPRDGAVGRGRMHA